MGNDIRSFRYHEELNNPVSNALVRQAFPV